MTPEAALLQVIRHCGSQAKLAKKLGVTQSCIAHWLSRGRPLRPEWAMRLSALTGVDKSLLRPDLWPSDPRDLL